MKAMMVIKVDFDSRQELEALALSEEELGAFVDGDGQETARSKVDAFLKTLYTESLYLGWNNQIYPQFRVKEIELL